MHTVKIQNANGLQTYIENEFKSNNLSYAIEQDEENFCCKAEDRHKLISYISIAISEYIIKKHELIFVKCIVKSYDNFKVQEKNEIFEICKNIIHNQEHELLSSLCELKRRNLIIKSLLNYFNDNDFFEIQGFMNFRLKEYKKELKEVVDRAVDNFLMEREHKEFIRLLKYFISQQEPQCKRITVTMSGGKYLLTDENNGVISQDDVEKYEDKTGGEVNQDDFLVSSLVTWNPPEIIIQAQINPEVLQTIKLIFESRVKDVSNNA